MDMAAALAFAVEKNPAPVSAQARQKLLENPGFGQVATDHMAVVTYTEQDGWHDAKIVPRQAFNLDPAALVLHYAQEIFEGLKAYRLPDGGVTLFRPDANAQRFARSATRMAMPPLPEALFVESLHALVRADADWVPGGAGQSLYLRPFMFASDPMLGIRPGSEYQYCVTASPVAPIFKGGDAGVTLWVSDTYVRAAPGGTGAAKCGGNYAAGLAAQQEAAREGCDQVIFLDAVERRWIEELGGMNVCFVMADGSLVTPPLGGTILPGITRDSLLTLARDMGITVREEPYAIDQCHADAESGRLAEAFACGTAAVVTPIVRVKGRKHSFTVGAGRPGPVTQRLHAALTDIQFGRASDTHGWLQRVG